MNTKVSRSVLGLAIVFAASPSMGQVEYDMAEVVAVRPLVRVFEVSTPEEQCWEEEYLVDRRQGGYESATPAIVGTVIGGAIGNAVGHNKSNQRVGAVVGAVLGHSVARDIMARNRGPVIREVETVQRCETVYRTHEEERIVGYNVTYNYHGQDYTVRTDQDPGSHIRVRVSVEPLL